MSALPGLTDTWEYRTIYEALTTSSLPTGKAGNLVWAGPLKELANYRAAVDELTVRLIDDYRKAGATWEYIGAALGMSKQAASQLHKRARRRGL